MPLSVIAYSMRLAIQYLTKTTIPSCLSVIHILAIMITSTLLNATHLIEIIKYLLLANASLSF